jgi:putative transposase
MGYIGLPKLKDEFMPRLPRCAPPGIPQHIIQRGNDRQPCFDDPSDFAVYLSRLDESARRHCVDIHAWVLMTNHVHLLVTPHSRHGVSDMMQSLGRDYVSWFNHHHERTGTLWEGRFKSCLVDTEHYLFQCYRYIEMNPVRAGMVSHPADYWWSSFRCNALGRRSKIVVPHDVYLQLGKSMDERAAAYRQMFLQELSDRQLEEIRAAIKSGTILGSERFKDDCEARLGRRIRPGVRGRRSGS